jgi:hypothetical protein
VLDRVAALENAKSVIHVAQEKSLLEHLAARVLALDFFERHSHRRLQLILGNDYYAVDIGEYDVPWMDEDVSAADGTSVVNHDRAGGRIDGTKSGAKDRKAHLLNALHIARVTIDEAARRPPCASGSRQEFTSEAGAL